MSAPVRQEHRDAAALFAASLHNGTWLDSKEAIEGIAQALADAAAEERERAMDVVGRCRDGMLASDYAVAIRQAAIRAEAARD